MVIECRVVSELCDNVITASESNINEPLSEHVSKKRRACFEKFELYAGITPAVFGHYFGENASVDEVRAADAEASGFKSVDVADLSVHFFLSRENLPD